MAKAFARDTRAGVSRLDREDERDGGSRVETCHSADDARADGEAKADAEQRDRCGRRPRILRECAHEAEEQQRHRDRERHILRVHEHVPVVERAGGQQEKRDQAAGRTGDAPCDAPCDDEPGKADDGAGQAPRLEQIERQHLGKQRREHVEARRRTCRD